MSADHFFIATMQSRKSPVIEEKCHHVQKRQVSKKLLDYGEASIYVRSHVVTIIDWYSRRVLAWRLSNTLDTSFCVEALQEAIASHGTPEIFNNDQGSQFTSDAFTDELKQHNIRINMDGKGRWMDNVFV